MFVMHGYLCTYVVYIGVYFTGDGALRDENGLYRITGRVDDIIISKGHRIGTAELECAMVSLSSAGGEAHLYCSFYPVRAIFYLFCRL